MKSKGFAEFTESEKQELNNRSAEHQQKNPTENHTNGKLNALKEFIAIEFIFEKAEKAGKEVLFEQDVSSFAFP